MGDLTVNPILVQVSDPNTANPIRGTSTGAITAGDVVAIYADGTIGRADANGPAPTDTPVGIAVCSTPGAGQLMLYVSQDAGFEPGAPTTSGVAYFLSGNPGKICLESDLTAGMKTSLIGFGKSDGNLSLNIVPSGQTI
jgi:hypothetical protein